MSDAKKLFVARLAAFEMAALELEQAWEALKAADRDVKGYPAHWESFDDECTKISQWKEANHE